MFAKLAILVSALSILAVATPYPGGGGGGGGGGSSCTTGSLQCCDTTGTASDPAVASVLAGLGITVQDVNALIGLTCTPITVIGVGSGSSW